MPSICEFMGMWITINWSDHNPPHFHVRAGEYSAAIAIETGKVLGGRLPPVKLKYLRQWIRLHQSELTENWHLAQLQKPLRQIKGL